MVQAQGYGPPGQSQLRTSFEGLMRQEWTDSIGSEKDDSRRQFRLLAGLHLDFGWLATGVGGDFNYSQDDNTEPPEGEETLALIRDNYRSRDARLDLAYARLAAGSWLRLEGGRFEMPIPLTEMIWDRDLRPQGGAATLAWSRAQGGLRRLSVTALGARGSHVFEDEDTNMVIVSGGAVFETGRQSSLELNGSFIRFTDTDTLEPMIRRQNSLLEGELVHDYDVVDVQVRLRTQGDITTEIVADWCWNRTLEEGNRGRWLAVVLGSLETAGRSLEYVYSKVDPDATLAAYGTDDFLWTTGREGHRAALGFRTGERSSFHVIGQVQRFKDAPDEQAREDWVKRLRLEMRFSN